jgi:propionyl-CoA carboxylase alpha chain
MIRSAAGEKLAFGQNDLKINGWAVESRIYAEDPYRKFLPSIGRLVRYDPPAQGEAPVDSSTYVVRNDSGVREGDEISMFYDPMIAKLCTWGKTRSDAVEGMARALEDFHIEGLGHNVPFLSAVMDQERFREGRLSTGYIGEEFPDGFHGLPPSGFQRDVMTAVAVYMQHTLVERARRAGGAGPLVREAWSVLVGRDARDARVTQTEVGLDIELTGEGRSLRLEGSDWRPGKPLFRATLDGQAFTATVKPAADGFVVRHRAAEARVKVLTPKIADLYARLPEKAAADTSRLIVSPMPGLVVSIEVTVGQEVKEGETVAVIEAMKMQNIIKAERDGVVKSVGPKGGDSVAADEVLVEFA